MQYGGVAANDERKAAEVLDAVSNPHWQLLLQVPGTFQKVAAVLRSARIEHHGWSEAD